MDLLAFKLIAAPLLLLAATVAIRRWGEAIGGFLVGLPLTSGPISVFLALEHGPVFATQATSGSLTATAAQAAFCFAYFRLARKGWPVALAGACAAFIVTASLLQWSSLQQTGLFVVALLAMTSVLYLTPGETVVSSRLAAPWWDLPARMVLMICLVIGVTLIAPHAGPKVSGVLASFPFMAVILAVFAHRNAGHVAGRQILRGMVAGLLGFASFFYVLSLMLTRSGLLVAYGCAVMCALAAQGVSFYRMRRPIAEES